MKRSLIFTLIALRLGHLAAQDETIPAPITAIPRVVLEQTTVQQKDGGSVTFQKIVPRSTPVPVLDAPVALTPEEQARQAEIEAKTPAILSVSATVHAGGFAVLRWSCGERGRLEAVSNVDFRLLAGVGAVETASHYYSLVMAAGADETELTPAQAAAARTLPQDGRASFVLVGGKTELTPEERLAVTGMEVLHAFFAANRVALIAKHQQREAEREARELAARNAPPPPPRHAVIQFWPLSAEQKAALRAARSASPAAGDSTTGGTK